MEKEEFLKLLPKLIREDDEVKGAIITALSGVIATKEDIKEVIREFDKRFEAMDKRFEAMDKRFETLTELMRIGFEDARKERESLRVSISTLSTRTGHELENAILNILSDKLIQENIEKSKITQKELIDREGKVYYKNYNTDVDVLIHNSKLILIEIKAKADNRDVFDLLKKGELFKETQAKKYDHLILICLEISQKNYEQAISQGIKVISGKII